LGINLVFADFLIKPIGRRPGYGEAWPSVPGLTVALPFLKKVSSLARVRWGGGWIKALALQQRKEGVGRHG